MVLITTKLLRGSEVQGCMVLICKKTMLVILILAVVVVVDLGTWIGVGAIPIKGLVLVLTVFPSF